MRGFQNYLPRIKLNVFEDISLGILLILLIYTFNTKLSSGENSIIIVYFISFLSILMMLNYVIKFGFPKGKINNIFLVFAIYILFIFFYAFISNDIDGFRMTTRLIVLLSLLFLFCFIKWNRTNMFVLAYLFSFVTLHLFLGWLIEDRSLLYSGIFYNANNLGIFIYLILYFHLIAWIISKRYLSKFFWAIIIVLDLVLIATSNARSIWLSLLVSCVFYIVYNFITSKRVYYRLSFFVIIFLVLLFSYAYPMLYTMDIGWKINEIIFNYTGKNFFSGRQWLWMELGYYINKQPFMGYGVSILPSDLLNTDLSSHNMYIQLLLQTGFIGLSLFILLLFMIWDYFFVKNGNKLVKLSLAFFGGLIVYQTFEMSFIQGNYHFNVLQWILISMGISFVNDEYGTHKNSHF